MKKTLSVWLAMAMVAAAVISSGAWVFGEKVAVLADVMKPASIQADDTQLYVIEGATVYIYSLKDYKLIKKFGKEGQGPGEFAVHPRLPPSIDVSTADIIVNSLGRISYFAKDGTFKKELKTTTINSFMFQPLGDLFLGMSQAMENNKIYNTVNLYDSKSAKLKELYKADSGLKGPGKGMVVLQKVFWFQAYDNKIFLPGETDASIDVFDKEMKKLFTVQVKSPERKVTEEFKNEVIKYLQTSPRTKDIYDVFLKPVEFPAVFPTIQFFFTDDNKLYVMTWAREKENNEFQTFDMKGNFLKAYRVPLAYQSYLEAYPLAVKNGKLYQVIENPDDESWELHLSEIK